MSDSIPIHWPHDPSLSGEMLMSRHSDTFLNKFNTLLYQMSDGQNSNLSLLISFIALKENK